MVGSKCRRRHSCHAVHEGTSSSRKRIFLMAGVCVTFNTNTCTRTHKLMSSIIDVTMQKFMRIESEERDRKALHTDHANIGIHRSCYRIHGFSLKHTSLLMRFASFMREVVHHRELIEREWLRSAKFQCCYWQTRYGSIFLSVRKAFLNAFVGSDSFMHNEKNNSL